MASPEGKCQETQHPGIITLLMSLIFSYNIFSPLIHQLPPLATCLLLSPDAITLIVPYILLYNHFSHLIHHPTGDLPSLVTRCNHSHCPFSYNIFSPLLLYTYQIISPTGCYGREVSLALLSAEDKVGVAGDTALHMAARRYQTNNIIFETIWAKELKKIRHVFVD